MNDMILALKWMMALGFASMFIGLVGYAVEKYKGGRR